LTDLIVSLNTSQIVIFMHGKQTNESARKLMNESFSGEKIVSDEISFCNVGHKLAYKRRQQLQKDLECENENSDGHKSVVCVIFRVNFHQINETLAHNFEANC
jgi:hypothetical protein